MEFKRDLFMSPGLGDIRDSPSGVPHKWHHSFPEDKERLGGKYDTNGISNSGPSGRCYRCSSVRR